MQHTSRRKGGASSLHRGVPPSLTEVEKWFDFTDVNQNGCVSLHEVVFSLNALLRPSSRYEERYIRGKVEDSWRNYSSTCGRKISKEAFLSKKMSKFLIGVEKAFVGKFDSSRQGTTTTDILQSTTGPSMRQMNSSRTTTIDLIQGDTSSRRNLLLGTNRSRQMEPSSTRNIMQGDNSSTGSNTRQMNSASPNDLIQGSKNKRMGLSGKMASSFRGLKGGNYTTRTRSIPSLSTNPKEWFHHFDKVDRGALNKTQIINALTATLDAKTEEEQLAIRENVGRIWNTFISRDDGTITKFEFVLTDGLADALKSMKLAQPKKSNHSATVAARPSLPQRTSLEPPPLSTNRGAWFDHFDTDHDKYLTQQQVIHGLNVTLRAEEAVQQNSIRDFILQIWPIYIGNTSGGSIYRDGFIMKDGFAECLIQNTSTLENRKAPPAATNQQQQSECVEIQVSIPQGMLPGQRLKIQSPRTSDLLVLCIPEQNKWGGGSNGMSYFFSVVL